MKALPIAWFVAAALMLSGCVSQQKYNALDQEYQQLQQSMGTEVSNQLMQITRLQNAIEVNVNGDQQARQLFERNQVRPVERNATCAKLAFDAVRLRSGRIDPQPQGIA